MMMTTTYLLTVMRAMLGMLWLLCVLLPTAAYASGVTLNATLQGLDAVTAALVFAFSCLGSLTAVVWRIETALRAAPDAKLPRPWLFVAAHFLGGITGGVLFFFVAESQDMNDWAELAGIVCGAFGGAKCIELVAERYLNRVLPTPGATS